MTVVSREVVVLGFAQDEPRTPQSGVPEGVRVRWLQAQKGWSTGLEGPPALTVVAMALEDQKSCAEMLDELRAMPEGKEAPVMVVVETAEGLVVEPLRVRGVRRILMRDEFDQDWPAILRAVG